jgi:hypothetical protein
MTQARTVDVFFNVKDLDTHGFLGVKLLPEENRNGGRPFFRLERREDGVYLFDGLGKGDSLPGAVITITKDQAGEVTLAFVDGLRVMIEKCEVLCERIGHNPYYMVYERPDGAWHICHTFLFFKEALPGDPPYWDTISISLAQGESE